MILRLIGLFIFLNLLIIGCQSNEPYLPSSSINLAAAEQKAAKLEENIFLESGYNELMDTNKFTWVLDSSFYKQPQLLLHKLDSLYHLSDKQKSKLLFQKNYILDGLNEMVYLVAVEGKTIKKKNCLVHPSNTYFLFDKQGQLFWKKQLKEADLVPMLKDSVATLLTLETNCNGEGKHHLYQYQNGEFIDILNALSAKGINTFDANPKGGMFYRNQLKYSISDINEDGHLDITLKGKWLVLENAKGRKYSPQYPYKIQPIEYQYLYIPTKESFLLQ